MMIWKSAVTRNTDLAHTDSVGIRDFRDVFRILSLEQGDIVFFAYTAQFKPHADKPDSQWVDTQMWGELRLRLDGFFKLGKFHAYYDGCHTVWSLGPLQFYRQPDNCAQCDEDFRRNCGS